MRLALALVLLLAAPPLAAQTVTAREGWVVAPTPHAYPVLLERLRAAIAAEGMGLVTEAGPTEVARARGVEIPGNRVLGVFRNDFAVRLIRAAPAATIEAPIRFLVTEEPDGTASLAWKTPGAVFAPYLAEGGRELAALGEELDVIFAVIAARAAAPE